MEFNIDIPSTIVFLAAFQGFLLSLTFLFNKKYASIANRWLGIFILCLSISLFGEGLMISKNIIRFPHLSRLHEPLHYLYLPFIFFYIRALIWEDITFKRKDYLHFIPAITVFLWLIGSYYFANVGIKHYYLKQTFLGNMSLFERLFLALLLIQIVSYFIYIFKLFRKHSNYIKDKYPNKIVYNWIKLLLILILIPVFLLTLRISQPFNVEIRSFLFLTLSFIVYGGAYMALAYPEKFATFEPLVLNASLPKYAHSSLDEDRKRLYLEQFMKYMVQKSAYLNRDISLVQVAEKLSISPVYLSQVINEQLNQTFTDFVNSKRIEAAKDLLRSPKYTELTITRIAYKTGFSTRATFNRVFKKLTGQTPRSYRELE